MSPTLNKKRVEELKEKEMHLPNSVFEDSSKINNLDILVLLISGKLDNVTTADDSLEFSKNHDLAIVI